MSLSLLPSQSSLPPFGPDTIDAFGTACAFCRQVKFNVMVNDYMWSPNGEYIINSCEKGRIDVRTRLVVYAGTAVDAL